MRLLESHNIFIVFSNCVSVLISFFLSCYTKFYVGNDVNECNFECSFLCKTRV